MQDKATFTVSESKRLIAKAVARHPIVKAAKKSGTIVIATGSTNSYVAEEVLGQKIAKRGFLTGHYAPAKLDRKSLNRPPFVPDIILEKGRRNDSKSKFEIVHEMGTNDVFIKGANALNYLEGVAGIAVGDLKGGTIGQVIGAITGRKIPLLIPVGLEKLVVHEILESWRMLTSKEKRGNGVTGLFPVYGEIVTEIEAIELLYDISATHVGSGGIFGAEGGTVLLLEGKEEKVARAKQGIKKILGEPPY